MKHLTVANYRQDKYYPSVVRAVAKVLTRSDVVAPVEVLIEMQKVTRQQYEDWRRGRIPYLERVFQGSLSKAGRILRLIRFHVHDLDMVPSWTAYHQWGKGRHRRLQFSKSGDPALEEAYATHFLWNKSEEKKRRVITASTAAVRSDTSQEHLHKT